MWEVYPCIRNITRGHTCHEQQSTGILPECIDTFRIDRVDYWQHEKVYRAGCIGAKSMANQEHLDILKQGVAVWNQWRQKHIYIQSDFSSTGLSSIDLGFVRLSSVDLSHADLSHADLSHADLSHADLQEANLRETSLFRADL